MLPSEHLNNDPSAVGVYWNYQGNHSLSNKAYLLFKLKFICAQLQRNDSASPLDGLTYSQVSHFSQRIIERSSLYALTTGMKSSLEKFSHSL